MITHIDSYLERARAQLPAEFKFDPIPFGYVLINGAGTGTITPTGTPNSTYRIYVQILGAGQAGTAHWEWSLDGVTYTDMGTVASGALAGTGITVTLNNGVVSPSFEVGTIYSFSTPYYSRIDGFLQAWMSGFQEIEDAMYDVFVDRCIQNGLLFGNLEDIIGSIVGQPRQGMTDLVYSRFITGRIAANRSDGKRETLIHITQLLTPGPTQVVVTEYVGSVVIDALAELDPTDYPNLIGLQFLAVAVAAGIMLYFIWSGYPADQTFTYSDTNAIDTSTPNEGYGNSVPGAPYAPGGYYASVVTGG